MGIRILNEEKMGSLRERVERMRAVGPVHVYRVVPGSVLELTTNAVVGFGSGSAYAYACVDAGTRFEPAGSDCNGFVVREVSRFEIHRETIIISYRAVSPGGSANQAIYVGYDVDVEGLGLSEGDLASPTTGFVKYPDPSGKRACARRLYDRDVVVICKAMELARLGFQVDEILGLSSAMGFKISLGGVQKSFTVSPDGRIEGSGEDTEILHAAMRIVQDNGSAPLEWPRRNRKGHWIATMPGYKQVYMSGKGGK